MTILVALRSKQFGKFLSLNAAGVTPQNPTGGTAVTQKYISTWETFKLIENPNGTVSFGSIAFQNAFLRADGTNVPPGTEVPGGGGVVNAHNGAQAWEQFKIVKKPTPPNTYTGTVWIESAAFPGRFLRMDGNKNQVNLQGVAKTFEEWEILVIGRA